jgi:hypothetical protein
MLVNVRKYPRDNKTNVQPRETDNIRYTRRTKQNKNTTQNVSGIIIRNQAYIKKTRHAALQIAGGKDEPRIVFMWNL